MNQHPLDPLAQGTGTAGLYSEDTLLGGRVILRQPKGGYRVAIDPLLLAASIPTKGSEAVLDLGCGVGAAALCLMARVPSVQLTGVDVQGDLVRLAIENAQLNHNSEHFRAFTGDVCRPPAEVVPGSFDHVMCNPPHISATAAKPTRDMRRATANNEGEARLADWVKVALAMVRPRGSITLIHRADRLHELLAAFAGRAGEIVVFPLWPAMGKPAKRVLIRARKAVATPTKLAAGLVLHESDGCYTVATETILRDAEALVL